MRRTALLLATAALAAGCGGDDRMPAFSLEPAPGDAPAEPGVTVLRFVQAARAGDTGRMRALMSEGTRQAFGPRGELTFADVLDEFFDARVVLSLELDERWALGAVAGVNDDGDAAAWAAALAREDGGWKLELGTVAFSRLRPAPARETDSRPEVRVEAQAGAAIDDLRLWVAPREVRAYPVRRSPFTREIWGRLEDPLPPGPQTAVAFAVAGDTAGAAAWPFEVDG